MYIKRATMLLAALLLVGVCGCSHNEMFSALDRHCYLADWTNHHSCLSCCPPGSWEHP
jgi:hypothetical protein